PGSTYFHFRIAGSHGRDTRVNLVRIARKADAQGCAIGSASLAGGVLSPSLLACLHGFVHVSCWPNLKNVAICQRRMLADELYRMSHVPRLKDKDAAEVFLGFHVGTIGGCHFAVLPVHGQRGFRRLEGFSASPVTVGAKMVIVIKACVEHGVLFSRGHALEFAFVRSIRNRRISLLFSS